MLSIKDSIPKIQRTQKRTSFNRIAFIRETFRSEKSFKTDFHLVKSSLRHPWSGRNGESASLRQLSPI